jgi:hypothetical protein
MKRREVSEPNFSDLEAFSREAHYTHRPESEYRS